MKNPVASLLKFWANRPNRRSPHWPAVRRQHLLKEGFCRYCGGTKNLEVHHIRPFHLAPTLELDPKNLITLCECFGSECHLKIGHLGNWRSFNPNVMRVANCRQPAT